MSRPGERVDWADAAVNIAAATAVAILGLAVAGGWLLALLLMLAGSPAAGWVWAGWLGVCLLLAAWGMDQ